MLNTYTKRYAIIKIRKKEICQVLLKEYGHVPIPTKVYATMHRVS